MSAQWTADIVGKLHLHKIEHRELAQQLKMTPQYISMVLNGKATPKDAERRFNEALDALLREDNP